jgi:heptosyltransferase-2
MLEYYLDICRWLGLDIPDNPRPALFIGKELRRRGDAFLAGHGIGEEDLLIGLNPGASFGASKCWPAERFAELAELCEERSCAKSVSMRRSCSSSVRVKERSSTLS